LKKECIFGQKIIIPMKIPDNLKYTKDHEWVQVDGNTVTVGITDFAQGELGDIVYVEIETTGEEVAQGDIFGTIEAVKTVSDLFMPISGVVEEINSGLEDNPEVINEDCYGKGWMVKIKVTGDGSELDDLLSSNDYKEVIGS